MPSNCIEQLYSRLYTAFGFGHSGPCLFDRPTIASEMRKLQNSERPARIREREVKLSPEAEQITPERSSRKSHPYRRHCDERDHTSMNATRRQLFAPSQPSAAHLPRQPSAGTHGLDYSAPAHGLDAVDGHPQSQPQPQACARAMDIPASPSLIYTPAPTSLSRVSAASQAACTSFTETLGNLRSELEDLDAHLVSVQLSAESHPQKATMRPLRAGYNLPKAFAGHHTGEELRTTLPNLLAHLRRASSSISLLPATASPAKPMAQARHGIEYLRVWWSRGYGVRRGES